MNALAYNELYGLHLLHAYMLGRMNDGWAVLKGRGKLKGGPELGPQLCMQTRVESPWTLDRDHATTHGPGPTCDANRSVDRREQAYDTLPAVRTPGHMTTRMPHDRSRAYAADMMVDSARRGHWALYAAIHRRPAPL